MVAGRRVRGDIERLWSVHYVLAIAVNLCIAAIFYLLITTMALYAIRAFETDEVVAGIVSGSFVVGAVVARLIGGKFLDAVGRRRTLLLALLACVGLGLAQMLVTDLTVLILVRGLHGIAFGAASTAVSAGAFSIIPASRRGEGAGYYGISTTLGSAIGPIMGTYLIGAHGFESLFLAATGWAVVGLVAALALRLPERALTLEDRAALRSRDIWTFVDRRSLPVAMIMLIAGVAFSGVLSFVNPYSVVDRGEPIGGSYFAVYAGVVLVSRLFVGRLHDRFGDDAVVYPLLLCLVTGSGILWFGTEGWLPYASAVLMGFGFGALMPTVQSITVGLAGHGRIALATSTFFLAVDVGVGLGPIVDGMLVGLLGYGGMYLSLAGIGLVGIAYYASIRARQPARRGA